MEYLDSSRLVVKRERPFIKRDDFSNVQQIGFVTVESQVKAMMYAGQVLMDYRRSAYDYPDGEVDVDSACPDPTLDVGFDLADASELSRVLASKIESAKEKGVNEGKDTSVPSADEVKE